MRHQLFSNLQAFIDAWHQALSTFDAKTQDILVSVILQQKSRRQIAPEYGFTHQHIAQIIDKGILRLRSPAGSTDHSPIGDAIANATRIIDAAGLELAYKLKSFPTPQNSRTVAQQLVNISAISPEQADWATAAILITPKPAEPRPSLKGLTADARQVAGQHVRGISPRHLRQHLSDWRQTMAAWPKFSLPLHITAVTGISPHPKSSRYHPIKGWTTPIAGDPLLTKHYITRALDKAGQPLTIPEIVQSANRLARLDGIDRTYTTIQIAGTIHLYKGYKWAGPGTYGLKSWDVGHSSDIQPISGRTQITPEIVHLLLKSTEPVAYDDIQQHILRRFNVTPGAIDQALTGQHGRQRFTIHPDRTVSLKPQDTDSHSI